MRNVIKFILLLLAISMAFSACKKEVAPVQQEQFPNYGLGLIFLPADEYAQLPVAPLPDNVDLKALPTSASLSTPRLVTREARDPVLPGEPRMPDAVSTGMLRQAGLIVIRSTYSVRNMCTTR